MIFNKISKILKSRPLPRSLLNIKLHKFSALEPLTKLFNEHQGNHLFKELHDRDYDIFIEKMHRYMKSERDRKTKINNYISDINKLSVISREPLKEILESYSVITNYLGFDPVILSETCLVLGKTYNSREDYQRVYMDYNEHELFNSYRMYYLIEDLKYAVTNDHSYFTSEHLATSLKGLTMLNFKSTELVELIGDKLNSLINKTPMNKKYERFADIPGAGRYNFLPRNQYAADIVKDSNFKSHVDKLMKTGTKEDDHVDEIREVINYLRDTKELRHQFADTIDNLLDQYIKIEQAMISNKELNYNPYIKYEVYKLQDKLVETGFMNVNDLLNISNKKLSTEEIQKIKNENSVRVLRDFVAYNFPDLFAFNNIESKLEIVENYTINESNFKINDHSYGKVMLALANYCKIKAKDINPNNDFKNENIKVLFKNKNLQYEYTKIFELTENLFINFEKDTINFIQESNSIISLGYILQAINTMNYNNKLDQMIIEKMENLEISGSNEDLIETMVGLAKSTIHNQTVEYLIKKISAKVDINDVHSLDKLVKILWSLSSYKLYNELAFVQSYINLITNHNYKNWVTSKADHYYIQLYNILKSDKNDNNKLISLESSKLDDPIKDMLNKWIKDNLFYKNITKEYHTTMTEFENLPFKPDLIFGYYNNKIALFLQDRDYMSDNFTNGLCYNMKRILFEKHNTYSVFISKKQLVKFNLNSLEISLKDNCFDFNSHINQSIEDINKDFDKGLNTNTQILREIDSSLNKFIKNVASDDNLSLIIENSEASSNFLNSLNEILDLNNDMITTYSNSMVQRKIIEIKLALVKNEVLFASIPVQFKEYLNKKVYTLFKLNNYNYFIKSLISSISSVKVSNTTNNSKWFGKRLSVDIIPEKQYSIKDKNIAVEFLDNNFMWLTDYNPYTDWEEELRVYYDNFNYFLENNEYQYLYNSHKLGNRHTPIGIFPHPFNYKKIKFSDRNNFKANSSYEMELKKYRDYNKYLVENELERNINGGNIPLDVSMKVNLLNIKNALKQNLSDNQIINFITQFEFTDKLIKEHIGENSSNSNEQVFLNRSKEGFTNLYDKLAKVKPLYDEYDKTIMKEYYKESNLFNAKTEEDLMNNMKVKFTETVDDDALSIFNANTIDYKFNIKDVMAAYNIPEYDIDINKSDFLQIKRRQAERNIILLKISIKMIQGIELTSNENNYLTYLKKQISEKNITNISESGLTKNVTKLTIADLTPNDLYMLNSLPNVEINNKLNNYSLSELLLEVSQFIDNTTINKILHEMYSVINKEKLGIESDYSIFNVDNKEPTLLSNEIKESLWRIAGHLNQEDKKIIKSLLSIKRGKGRFDDKWLKLDERSLEHFIEDANSFEDRLKLFGKWIKRKEKEIENRIHLPSDNMLSDKQINKLVTKQDTASRKKLLLNIFNVENTNQISRDQINKFINEYCTSLYLFNFEYPQQVIDIYYALLNLEITAEERQMLECYRKIFKLDEFDDEYLAIRPIELNGEKFHYNQEIEKKVEYSNIEFIKPLVKMILNK